jgi:hypothetical protein
MDLVTIKEFFIFNTKLKSPLEKPNDDEVQDAKLLYYYPENTETLVKRSNMGIIEGTTAFMKEFEKSKTNFLLTELNKVYFLADNYEEDFTICFILVKKSANPIIFNKYENIETKKKWLKSLIDHFYNTFILFHNTLSEFFISKEKQEINVELPKEKYIILKDFLLNYMELMNTLRYPLIENLQYFPMSSNMQATLLLSIQRLQEKIPELKMTAITYKCKLIHSQLPFDITSLLYNIFFSCFDSTPKYGGFAEPPYEVMQNIALKPDLKINDEKLFSQKSSPFRKAFKLVNSKSDFLIGIKETNLNNCNVFIPNIYIKELNAEYRFMVYYYHEMVLFLFIDKKFNVVNQLPKLKKISKWVDKFFKSNLDYLTKISKSAIPENSLFCYTNNANRSIRLCGFFKKNQLDEKLFDMLKKSLFNNGNNDMSGLTKFKGYYIYYIKSMGRRITMFFRDNLNLAQLNHEINNVKKENFQYIFLD